MSNFNEFIEYCLSFYGPNGLYDQGRTREQVAYATLMYLDACNDMITWGDGDSLDRERVRYKTEHLVLVNYIKGETDKKGYTPKTCRTILIDTQGKKTLVHDYRTMEVVA